MVALYAAHLGRVQSFSNFIHTELTRNGDVLSAYLLSEVINGLKWNLTLQVYGKGLT